MRRLLAGVVVLVLMGVATAAIGHDEPASYRDEFNTVGYSGSVGTIDWKSRPWSEVGETTNPEAGKVNVDAGCKCIAIKAGLLGIDSIGVRRSADLSHFEGAKLYFDIDSEGLLKTLSTAVVVEVTSDGTTWDEVYVYGPGDGQVSRSVSIDDWMSANFGVRFRALDLLQASVFIDNVEISGRLAHEESATTTTTAATITITVPTSISVPTTISLPTTIVVPVTSTTTALSTPTTESKDVPGSTTTTERPDGAHSGTTTTTTLDQGTTTTISEETAPLPSDRPPGTGPRESTGGLQVGYQSRLFGSFDDDGPEVLGVELSAEFRTAVELIKTSWIWMLALAGLIATFVVAGLDHRGSLKESIT